MFPNFIPRQATPWVLVSADLVAPRHSPSREPPSRRACRRKAVAAPQLTPPQWGPRRSPASAGSVGRGRARERVKFSPSCWRKRNQADFATTRGSGGAGALAEARPLGRKPSAPNPRRVFGDFCPHKSTAFAWTKVHPPVGAGPDDLKNRLPVREPATSSPQSPLPSVSTCR